MILTQELIKHFVLGIVSLLILGNSMAEASESFPKSFYETVVKVQSEYDEDSFERKVNPPHSFDGVSFIFLAILKKD